METVAMVRVIVIAIVSKESVGIVFRCEIGWLGIRGKGGCVGSGSCVEWLYN
jgi:hypothetical protein